MGENIHVEAQEILQIKKLVGEEEWVEEGFQNDENQQWWNSDYQV